MSPLSHTFARRNALPPMVEDGQTGGLPLYRGGAAVTIKKKKRIKEHTTVH